MEEKISKESHNYSVQRNYKFESHDADGNFLGITEDEWKEKIRDEWTCDKLKANYIVFIFHDKDIDEHGNIKELHVHGCINFIDSIPASNARKLSGCSSDKNCKIISNKSSAYRYLLHITEKAIRDKKHIYDEDCLEYSIATGKTFDFKAIIKKSEQDEEDKNSAKLIKQTIIHIMNGAYGDGNPWNFNPMLAICANQQLAMLIAQKPTYRRAIENAIEVKKTQYYALTDARYNNVKGEDNDDDDDS